MDVVRVAKCWRIVPKARVNVREGNKTTTNEVEDGPPKRNRINSL